MSISLSHEGVFTIIKHSLKYLTQYICGVLVQNNDSITAIPVFHSLPLHPIMDMAAELLLTAMNEKRQKIIGVYYGNEVNADKGIPAAISSFASLFGNDIPLVRVDSISTFSGTDAGEFLVMVSPPKQKVTSDTVSSEEIQEGIRTGIIDFEDFMDDPSQRWLL